MDRNTNAAPFEDASAEPGPVAHTGVRSIAGIVPEGAVWSEGRRSVSDAALAASVSRSKLLSPGTCVDQKYIICDVLGTGGAAVVYAAEQLGLKRVVAFKVYPVGAAMAPKLVERFEHEAQLLARVHHENVVAIFDSGSMPDGSPYLVVQRLHGESLAERLLDGPLPLAEVVELTHQILSALSALSDAGITHRDVKPDNLVLDRDAEGRRVVKLVDFGIAKDMKAEGSSVLEDLVGTPSYMAPEQVRGEAVDARCDLYALGATLYEMLTGRTPHIGESVDDIARATLFAPIIPVRELRRDCPPGLDRLVMKALARAPEDRFASAREMKHALELWETAQEPELLLVRPKQARALEETLRIPTRSRASRPGGTARKLGFAAVVCLLALGVWAVPQTLHVGHRASEPIAPHAAQASQASEATVFDLVPQTSALASALVAHAGASAGELWIRVRTGARELLELARHSSRAWNVERRRQQR